jgi:hypothetical protein
MITCKTISKLARDFNCEDFSQRKTTKKGDRRKTVSKRRAYVNTPLAIAKKVANIANSITDGKYSAAYREAAQLAEKLSGKRFSELR